MSMVFSQREHHARESPGTAMKSCGNDVSMRVHAPRQSLGEVVPTAVSEVTTTTRNYSGRCELFSAKIVVSDEQQFAASMARWVKYRESS